MDYIKKETLMLYKTSTETTLLWLDELSIYNLS